MTATPPVDRAAASRLVAALEPAWTAIRTHHPDVPQVVIVVASGGDPWSRRLNLGHFAAGRWQLSPNQATERAEVLVSGEGLQRGPVDVLGTLLYEAAHGLAHARKVSDTRRQGRYHNRRYATLASELGLEVAHRQPIGLVGDQRPPSRPPPATPTCWLPLERRWCSGAAPGRPPQPAQAALATPWPAPLAAAAASAPTNFVGDCSSDQAGPRQVNSNLSTLTVSVDKSSTNTVRALMRSPAGLVKMSVLVNLKTCPLSRKAPAPWPTNPVGAVVIVLVL
jgi:hypothetical protein